MRTAAALTVALALAGCSSAVPASLPAPASPAAQVPGVMANPVSILREAHARTSAVYGQADAWGDRYAVGYYPEDGVAQGEQVYAYTFDSAAAQQADLARSPAPQDGQALIEGDLFDVYVIGMPDASGGWGYAVSPAAIAILVHGRVVSP